MARNRASSYVNPLPGGTQERTDQGVDISAPPGSPVVAIANEQLVGVIPNWYKGQPFYWFQQLGTNVYNYVAEQFSSTLKIGQVVHQGQRIGSVASSGTGLEFGFATASGRTLAAATTGYTEGQATPAGQSYRQQVLNGASGNSNRLSQLWIEAGGPPNVANIMAAIAMAESGGQNIVQKGQPYATTGWGLWQITPGDSVPSIGVDKALLDPLTNARAAVAKYRSQGLGAWTTYTSGAYKSFLPGAGGAVAGGSVFTRPGGGTSDPGPSNIFTSFMQEEDSPGSTGSSSGPQFVGLFGLPDWLAPNPLDLFGQISTGVTSVVDFLQIIAWILHPRNILRVFEIFIGITVMLVAFWNLSKGMGGRGSLTHVAEELALATPVGRGVEAVSVRRAAVRQGRKDVVYNQQRRQTIRESRQSS